mmetsp:Transcript_6238/g.22177  ORF Transcript_6238/g.22177 Transcript_6238/m.22177 type:complete len:241 (+) Transcript_6238:3306-4028(+)
MERRVEKGIELVNHGRHRPRISRCHSCCAKRVGELLHAGVDANEVAGTRRKVPREGLARDADELLELRLPPGCDECVDGVRCGLAGLDLPTQLSLRVAHRGSHVGQCTPSHHGLAPSASRVDAACCGGRGLRVVVAGSRKPSHVGGHRGEQHDNPLAATPHVLLAHQQLAIVRRRVAHAVNSSQHVENCGRPRFATVGHNGGSCRLGDCRHVRIELLSEPLAPAHNEQLQRRVRARRRRR